MKTETSLSETLINQNTDAQLSRLLLCVQDIIVSTSLTLSSHDTVVSDQLVSQINQTWLEKMIRSKAVRLMMTRCASNVLEVDQEHQGDLLVAFDPLTLGADSVMATSSFTVWSNGDHDHDSDISSVLANTDSLLCAGLVVFGCQTRVFMAGQAGCTEYTLDRRVGQLKTVNNSGVMDTGHGRILSVPRHISSELRDIVSRVRDKSELELRRTGLAGVDGVGVIRNGGVWVSDQDLGHLHQAIPLAFIGKK